MNIYLGNLSKETTEEELLHAFKKFGHVESVVVVTDKFTRESKGFAFIEMPSKVEGQSAIDGLNEKEIKGNEIIVAEARPRAKKPGDKKKFGGRKASKGTGRDSKGSGRGGKRSDRSGQGFKK